MIATSEEEIIFLRNQVREQQDTIGLLEAYISELGPDAALTKRLKAEVRGLTSIKIEASFGTRTMSLMPNGGVREAAINRILWQLLTEANMDPPQGVSRAI